MNKLVYICLCFFSLSGLIRAEVEITTLVVDGIGNSYYEAIQNGLIESLKQAEGVSITSQRDYAKAIKQSAVSTNNENSSHDVTVNEQTSHKINEATQGIIHQYSILNSQDDGNGKWMVQLEIQLKKYKTPGISPHSLRKIAVIPFRKKSSMMSVIDQNITAEEVSRQLNQKLVTELTQSRRFTVLDREYMSEFLKERNLLLSANASVAEQMKIGEALGVDYLLLGTITEFKAEQSKTFIKVLNENRYSTSAYFNADFRIMVMATRQIKWSDTVKIKPQPKQLKQAFESSGSQGVIDFVLEQAARKIVHSSLDNIYPIKILKVAGKDSIYLNQGGKMTSIGDSLEVYSKGEKIVDPDTGLSIKIDGERIAIIKVTKVQAKYSLAKLISGDIKQIEAGAILRKVAVTDAGFKKIKAVQKVMQPNW
jgi:curli biogenesis system outer membrane secretion channel CsgG